MKICLKGLLWPDTISAINIRSLINARAGSCCREKPDSDRVHVEMFRKQASAQGGQGIMSEALARVPGL